MHCTKKQALTSLKRGIVNFFFKKFFLMSQAVLITQVKDQVASL